MEILLEELNRLDLSNARDKLIQDIEAIKKGYKLKIGNAQTKWMLSIGECNDLIQMCREAQLNNTITKNQRELLKRLEYEWKLIYPKCKEYDELVRIYNRKLSIDELKEYKLKTFKERIGKTLIENKVDYFNY